MLAKKGANTRDSTAISLIRMFREGPEQARQQHTQLLVMLPAHQHKAPCVITTIVTRVHIRWMPQQGHFTVALICRHIVNCSEGQCALAWLMQQLLTGGILQGVTDSVTDDGSLVAVGPLATKLTGVLRCTSLHKGHMHTNNSVERHDDDAVLLILLSPWQALNIMEANGLQEGLSRSNPCCTCHLQ